MKRSLVLIFALTLSMALIVYAPAAAAATWTPTRPVTIITHVAPGGGMDIATRKLVDLARKYTDAVFVVDNRPGGATMIASDVVLDMPADGYTIFGAAVSNIASVVALELDRDRYVDGYDWIAKIQRDPGSIIITNEAKERGVTFHTLIEEAREMGGRQIWVGPSVGGTKHIDAMVIWQVTGVQGTWVPFESGPLAAAALLGGQGAAQSGNPFDTVGRELWNAAIAAPERMPGFEDSPTFAELGYPELNEIHMWRGYAVRKGTPPEMIEWFQNIVYQVANDPEWIEFNAASGITATAVFTEEFRAIIQETIDTNEFFLRELGLLE